ncbi:MAG: hypothetical protein BWY09_02620 [Candidatus Hydrogenedentes bacterium ADurb.Bin179]|nr:MAG: hypothetical protein BWY09_02620 [Candidatus Hydrogenedentes bacterium ADurb.Bin179]
MAFQVEIAVIGQVHGGRRIGDGRIFDFQGFRVGKPVSYRAGKIAGIPLVPVRAGMGQFQPYSVIAYQRLGGPQGLVKTARAAVKVVRPVILRQGVRLTVQSELPPGNAISITPDYGAEIGVLRRIAAHIIKTEHDISHFTVTVRSPQGNENAAIIGYGRFKIRRRSQQIQIRRRAFGCRTERSFVNGHGRFAPLFVATTAALHLFIVNHLLSVCRRNRHQYRNKYTSLVPGLHSSALPDYLCASAYMPLL